MKSGSKLSEDEIQRIRELFKTETKRHIAKIMDLNPKTVGNCLKEKDGKHD